MTNNNLGLILHRLATIHPLQTTDGQTDGSYAKDA